MSRLTAREKASRKAQRSKAQKKRMRSVKRYTLVVTTLLVALIATGSGWWLVNSGLLERKLAEGRAAWHQTLASGGLRLERLYIQGREKTEREQVLHAIGMEIGDSLYAEDLHAIRERVEALGTVRRASVERVLPDTLHITLHERSPAAVWQHQGALRLIDVDGVVLREETEDYPHLLVIVGEDAPAHLNSLLELLATEPELAEKVTAAVRVGKRRWNLTFASGVEVMLPEGGAQQEAWNKLVQMQRDQEILTTSIRAIDMRLQDRIFIKLPPEEKGTTTSGAPGNKASET